MNRTAEIRLAILRDLAHVPAGLLRREDDIRCRVQLQVVPSPSRAEIETELKELDALRLTATEHQALQTRWAQDTQTLEAVRTELASARSSNR